MTPQEYQRLKPLLTLACRTPAAMREIFVQSALPTEPDLQRQLLEIVATYERATQPFQIEAAGHVDLSSTDPIEPGALIGSYRVLAKIGEGGMGCVYAAQDTRFGRRVALKVVKPREEEGTGVEQLLSEARAAAQLSHPAIVTIYDVLREAERLVIVMEYVDGTSLARMLEQGPLPLGRALRLASQLADALFYAHSHDIVHCDVKPENVLVTRDGNPKLVDLGLAHMDVSRTSQFGRASEALWGTPAYLAPERLMGASPRPSSDIYALGVLFYQMLTGRLPFDVQTGEDVFFDVVAGKAEYVPASKWVTGIPPAVDDIAARCLTGDPRQRLQAHEIAHATASALQALDARQRDEPASGRTESVERRWDPARGAAAGLIVLVSLAGAAGFISSRVADLGLARTGLFQEGISVWFRAGLSSLVAPLTLVLVAVLLAGFVVSFDRILGRPLRLGDRVTRGLAWLTGPGVLGLSPMLLVLHIAAFAVAVWSYAPLLSAVIGLWQGAASSVVAPLAPVHSPIHETYRLVWTVILFVFGSLWVLAGGWWLRSRETEFVMPLAGGIALTAATVLLWAAPYGLIWNSFRERVLYGESVCYIVSEQGSDRLLFCPLSAPARSRVITASDPLLRARGLGVCNVFTELGPSPDDSVCQIVKR